jgi:hypothetical protein
MIIQYYYDNNTFATITFLTYHKIRAINFALLSQIFYDAGIYVLYSKMAIKLRPSAVKRIGLDVLGLSSTRTRQLSYVRINRIFRTCFGCSILVVTICWNLMVEHGKIPSKGVPKHLFWALSLLKSYDTETFYSVWFNIDPYTFRKWAWAFIGAISSLEIVSI